MNKADATDLKNRISESLLDSGWAREAGLPVKKMEKFILSSEFSASIAQIESARDCICDWTLRLCEGLMNSLADCPPPKGWLLCAYSYAQALSFPESADSVPGEYSAPCRLYLRILSILSRNESDSEDPAYSAAYPLRFMTDDEQAALEKPAEYRNFLHSFLGDHVPEMMRLSRELFGYNTLEHICGVHHIAMMLGRQFKKLGFPIDLGRVSGAAAGHDIGKYGCRPREIKRVPYLHYYYTDLWFKRHGITYIGNIAVNHSTWDLELENLPLESLILIYSDFRVKNVGGNMTILSLSESFGVIMNKLDRLDEAKKKRYGRVYAKLKDFEMYMNHLGMDTDPAENPRAASRKREPASPSLLQGNDIINDFKYLAIEHNINLMYQFRDEYSLDSILQLARSEKDRDKLREYVRAFEEYSANLTQKQKLQTISFMYELLIHPEEDIRNQSAKLIGRLIATYDQEYRKEIPDDAKVLPSPPASVELLREYLKLFLYPGHNIIPSQRSWIGYGTGIMLDSLFLACDGGLCDLYRGACLKYFDASHRLTREVRLYLLNASMHIPVGCASPEADKLLSFSAYVLNKSGSMMRIAALESVCALLPYIDKNSDCAVKLGSYLERNAARSRVPAENFLRRRAAESLGEGRGPSSAILGNL